MTSQKFENLLNLALDASNQEREKSLELNVGYDQAEQEWELIIKYSGSLDELREIAVWVTELQNEYAVILIKESRLLQLVQLPQVEYVEKPKRLFFQTALGKRVSCITAVQDARFALFGQGTLVAVIDSGIAYENMDFRNADGTTRIRALWDQTIQGNPPLGYNLGTEYTSEQINEALSQPTRMLQLQSVPSVDTSGHGTAVTGIAAGNGRNSQGANAGVASESGLIVVKLGTPKPEGFPRTTELIQAVDYVIRRAIEFGLPVAVNLSFGNTYGSHDGTSLLERFIDDISNLWKSSIVVGTGNEAGGAGHTSGVLREGTEDVVELAVQNNQPTVNVQLWKNYTDVVDIALISPSGVKVGPFQEQLGPQRFSVGNTEILLYYGEPSPYSTNQEIFIDFLPKGTYIDSGIWRFVLTPRRIVDGRYEMWLPSEGALNKGTGFLYPTETGTFTIPSTAARVISVGAYDARTFTYAGFSGRGRESSMDTKPDLVAPGVEVTAPTAAGSYAAFSGTSFATPFVTGSAALMMQWGIIEDHDPYLYGEKIKAYLRRGARPLPGFDRYPNPQIGYGALCLRDSFPEGIRSV